MTSPPDDDERFTVLVDAVSADVHRFVRRRLPDDGSDDVVAETFLVVWRRLPELPSSEDEARAWVFGIARGVLANARRSEGRRRALAVRLAELPASASTTHDEAAALRLDVSRAWALLGATDQEALGLHLLDGLTAPQAAHVLGISAVAYRLRLSRARRRLRALVDSPTPAPVAGRTAARTRPDPLQEATP